MFCQKRNKPKKYFGWYELENGIECELLAKPSKRILETLEYVSLDRDGEEIGPVEFQGEVKPHRRYALEFSAQDEQISLVSFDPRKHESSWRPPGVAGSKHNVGVCFEPARLNGVWDFPENSSSEKDDANIFGLSGTLHLNKDTFFYVPHYNALDVADVLEKKWGIQIVPFGTRLPSVREDHIMATYILNENFIKKWVHHKTNGP